MATTTFIAVQCCQCSTMQVKQQKKSSNKWVCAVCNQRQSVRRIHASGPLARNVRHFVQAFNFSRSELASDRDGHVPVPPFRSDGHGGSRSPISPSSPAIKRHRRMDWSEYLDPMQDNQEEEEEKDGGDLFEPEVVTEMPPEKLWRSSLKCPRRVQATATVAAEEMGLLKNSKRAIRKKQDVQKSHSKERSTESEEGRMASASRSRSKWSEYLEDGDDVAAQPQSFGSQACEDWSGGSCRQQHSNDTMVEEEVHPDFKKGRFKWSGDDDNQWIL